MAIFPKQEKEKQSGQQDEKTSAFSMHAGSVLVSPRVSEKASTLAGLGRYVFNVKANANKLEIAKAVEKAYKVKVTSVNVIKMEGKKRNYGRISGKTSDFKKAVVTLKAGDKIETQ